MVRPHGQPAATGAERARGVGWRAMRVVPALDALVELPAGRYEVGEPGEERACELGALLIGRWPVVNAHYREFLLATGRPVPAAVAAEALDDHPVTGVSRADAEAFCAWLGPGVRLPTGDEWEAAARGDRRPPVPVGRDLLRRALQLRRQRLGLDGARRRPPGRRRPVRRRAAGGQRVGVGRRPRRATAGASCAAARIWTPRGACAPRACSPPTPSGRRTRPGSESRSRRADERES